MCIWVSHWIFHSTDSFRNLFSLWIGIQLVFMSESLNLSLSLFFQQHLFIQECYSLLEISTVDSAMDWRLFYWWCKNKATGNLDCACTWPRNYNGSDGIGAIHTECVFAFHCQFSVVFLCKHMLGQQGSLLRLCHLQYSKNGPLEFLINGLFNGLFS